jgi:hypothetical protein
MRRVAKFFQVIGLLSFGAGKCKGCGAPLSVGARCDATCATCRAWMHEVRRRGAAVMLARAIRQQITHRRLGLMASIDLERGSVKVRSEKELVKDGVMMFPRFVSRRNVVPIKSAARKREQARRHEPQQEGMRA